MESEGHCLLILQGGLSIKHRAKAQINCEYIMLAQILNSDVCYQMDGLVGDSLSRVFTSKEYGWLGLSRVRALGVGGFCGRRSTEAHKEAN